MKKENKGTFYAPYVKQKINIFIIN